MIYCSGINDPSVGFISLSTTWATKIEWEKLGGIQKELPEKFDEVEGKDDVEGKGCGIEG